MDSSSKSTKNSPKTFNSPSPGPLQRHTHARVMRIEVMMKDILQLVTEIQVKQIRMGVEQQRQGRILRNLHMFLMDNPNNRILIDEESSGAQMDSEEEPMEEEEDHLEEAHVDNDDTVVCVGEVCFDREGNVVERNGNFCLHYPHCAVHKSPIVKDTP